MGEGAGRLKTRHDLRWGCVTRPLSSRNTKDSERERERKREKKEKKVDVNCDVTGKINFKKSRINGKQNFKK